MAHAQKPDFVFRRNGRVYLNRHGPQFSRLLVAEVCASAVLMLHTQCSEVVGYPPHLPVSPSFPLPCVRHRVPSHFNWSLLLIRPMPHGATVICFTFFRHKSFGFFAISCVFLVTILSCCKRTVSRCKLILVMVIMAVITHV
jgi:hypothetical protein